MIRHDYSLMLLWRNAKYRKEIAKSNFGRIVALPIYLYLSYRAKRKKLDEMILTLKTIFELVIRFLIDIYYLMHNHSK